MAIVLLEGSECPLCGNILRDSSDLFLFPPLISNMNDPLYIFSDSGVHETCLEKDSLCSEAKYFANKLTAMPPYICAISGNKIKNHANAILIGLLTSNRQESLFQFNFLKMDRQQLHKWKDRSLFIETATRFIEEGKWKGVATLQHWINELK